MSSNSAVEILCEDGMSKEKFWELANDLFYTKVYYDEDTQEYYKEKMSASDEGECSEEDMNMLLVSYITLSSTHCDNIIGQIVGTDDGKSETDDNEVKEEDFYRRVATFLLDTNYYKTNKEFCIRKMLSLIQYIVDGNVNLFAGIDYDGGGSMKAQIVNSLQINQRMLRIIGWILFVQYKEDNAILQILKEYQGFQSIASTLANYCEIYKRSEKLEIDKNKLETPASSHSYLNYLEIFHDLCEKYEFDGDDLMTVDESLFEYLLGTLKVATRDEDPLNFLKFNIILILNEQYMVRYYSQFSGNEAENNSTTGGSTVENKVFANLIESDNFSTFSESLMLNFNREVDHVVQILMLKILYLIFTTSKTCQWFYLNDLKVLVDIFIRELFNLSASKEESLINTYLRVLCPMLLFSNLKSESYKADSLLEVLKYLNTAEQSTATTRRLAQRCLDLDFFTKQEEAERAKEREQELKDEDSASVNSSSPINEISRQMSEVSVQSTISSIDNSPSIAFQTLLSRSNNPTISETAETDFSSANNSSSSIPLPISGSRQKKRPPPPPPRRSHNDSDVSLSRSRVSTQR